VHLSVVGRIFRFFNELSTFLMNLVVELYESSTVQFLTDIICRSICNHTSILILTSSVLNYLSF
jgi:hypothetical protein